jgi:uncharacterized membrane protein
MLSSSIAGVMLSLLILKNELGLVSKVSEKLCSIYSERGCEAVLKSKASNLFQFFKWSDAGIIYFFSISILLLITALYGDPNILFSQLTPISLVLLPIIIFSIYYQWQVIKQWCVLCILTMGMLSIQFSLMVIYLRGFGIIQLRVVLLILFVFGGVLFLWLSLIKDLLYTKKNIEHSNFNLIRQNNSPNTIRALIFHQRKINFERLEGDLQLANPEASLQIIAAFNPYCKPCAKAYNIFGEIIEKFGNSVGITIRFPTDFKGLTNKKIEAIRYLYQHVALITMTMQFGEKQHYLRQMLKDWYDTLDLNKFSKKYEQASFEDIDDILKSHWQWAREASINFTPFIAINGHEMPSQFPIVNLCNIIRFMDKN